MESAVIFLIGAVMLIGAIVVGVFGIAVFISWWWIAIPLVFTCFGGGFGFIFGVGLDVVIGFIMLMVMSGSENSSPTNKTVVVQDKPKPISLPDLQDKTLSCKRPIENDAGGATFRVCTSCFERNNPEFEKCWKCGASL